MSKANTIASILQDRLNRQGPETIFAYFTQDEPTTLGKLWIDSEGAASKLAELGATSGTRIMIASTIRPELLTTLLGIWRIGALAIPMDTFIQPESLLEHVQTHRPDIVLTEHGSYFFSVLNADRSEEYQLATIEDLRGKGTFPPTAVSTSPALCIFTSGSTGKPKGVVHNQLSLLAGARNVLDGKKFCATDNILCVLPLSHLNGLVTTFLAPLIGEFSVTYFQDNFSPTNMSNAIKRFGCTVFSGTPMHYSLLTSTSDTSVDKSLSSLRFCRSASAPLSENVHISFEQRFHTPLIETMGTSETAGQIFTNPLPPKPRKITSVGFPVGFETRIVDEEGNPCQSKVAGEIQVRGEGMMQGYLDDPVETAKAFDGEWLKTGDIAYADEDGYYFIVGRKKDIIIFCGINLSLSRLEQILNKDSMVFEAALVPRRHEIFGETFDAYIILADGVRATATNAQALFRGVCAYMPSPHCLANLFFVPEFPRSSAEKVLKNLLDPTSALFQWTPLLENVDAASFIATVLGVKEEHITEESRFGDIPEWDSLGYIAILAAVENTLGRKLDTGELDLLMSVKGVESLLEGQDKAKQLGVYDYGLHL